MQLHNIKPGHKSKRHKRIGRGGKRGGYSGRGIKGQKARSGAKIRPAIRELMMKLPKLRGQGGAGFRSFSAKPKILNLNLLEKNFQAGEAVTPAILVKRGLIIARGGRMPRIKILGDGTISKSLKISGVLLSSSARVKIEKAGGMIAEGVKVSERPEAKPAAKPAKLPAAKKEIKSKVKSSAEAKK